MHPILLIVAGFVLFAMLREQADASAQNSFEPGNVYDGEWSEAVPDSTEWSDDMRQIAYSNYNLSAFLWTIRWAEGTANDLGYQTLFGYEYFEDFSDHPRRVITKGGYSSAAAGAYQILPSTWDTVIKPRAYKYGIELPDFSPESQDNGAIVLLKYRDAYDDVIAGRFDSAIAKLGSEWASLPGSPYAQPHRTLAELRQVYSQAGGGFA